ncbi:hypothetical protein F4781DRAFT_315645 [Annulohypoxylon bovei var. microspora]|nr:hypothetical protein F4781DRAFT_315645 [Annulohypoxylon bovei var. microspora]
MVACWFFQWLQSTSTALASQIINLIEEGRRSSNVCKRPVISINLAPIILTLFSPSDEESIPGESMRPAILTVEKICGVSVHVIVARAVRALGIARSEDSALPRFSNSHWFLWRFHDAVPAS